MEILLLFIELRNTGKTAEYSAVATSVCVVEDVKNQNEFISFEEFYKYVKKYSVFERK